MKRRVVGFRSWRVGVLASIAILGSTVAVVAGSGSAGAASTKPFAVVLCAVGDSCSAGNPQVVAPGSATGTTPTPASLTATITDETTKGAGLTIGSVNLTAPSGITITSASLSGAPITGCTSTTPATTSCISPDGSELELRGLNVSPGANIQVPISIDTPPPPSSCTTATPCAWSAAAKQSNDYNGPPGNQLNLDPGSSQLGIILSSVATCTPAKKSNSCSTTLADGGASGSPGGSVSITTSATGSSSGTFYQSIDYGPHLPAGDCSGIDSVHDEYVSGAALNGSSPRSYTVTITTTDYDHYNAELCLTTSQPFTAVANPLTTPTLEPAGPVTQPDGSPGYAGVLPNCQGDGAAPTVNCKSLPGVVSRSTSPDGTVHTIVASFPAGFDATMRN